ncbi:MAG: restriction endonuclease subunit S [Bacteroidaceae bacterium]|nr:restriction endonuclease subunit S [Bacteroidaceae bacterium]
MQWLKEIPSHWEEMRVKYIANISKGNGITKLDVSSDGDTPCVRYGEIYTKYNNTFSFCYSATFKNLVLSPRYFEYGDILVSGTGELVEEIGKSVVYIGGEKCLAGGDIIILKHSQNPVFLNYALNTKYMQDQKSFGKAKLKVLHISSSEIGRLFITLPPLSEQEQIVRYLEDKTSKIDAYVSEKEKEILLLQELKQKTIADAVTKGLNPDVKMKDSGISWIGEIPEHWETKRVASFFTGKVETNLDFFYKHAFKFYYGTLVPKNEVGDEDEYRETYVKYSVIHKDDILINGLNLNYDFVSQRVAIVPSDGIITSAYIVVRPRKGTNALYYKYLFKAMDSMKLFHGMGTGIRLTLSYDELKKQVIVVPPADEQRSIVSYIEEKCQKIDSLTTELQSEIDYLKEYKQRLIADCVTGQINVQKEVT